MFATEWFFDQNKDKDSMDTLTWARLIPVDNEVRARKSHFPLHGPEIVIGRGSPQRRADVRICRDWFGDACGHAQPEHLKLVPDMVWLRQLQQRDWRGHTDELHAELKGRPLASAFRARSVRVWTSHWDEELGMCPLRCHDGESATQFDLYHGDGILLLPPRTTWRLSFLFEVEQSQICGWVDPADEKCEDDESSDEEEVICSRKRRSQRLIVDDDTSDDEDISRESRSPQGGDSWQHRTRYDVEAYNRKWKGRTHVDQQAYDRRLTLTQMARGWTAKRYSDYLLRAEGKDE